MYDVVEDLTRGNVTEVKVILASVVLALAVYQVLLMTVGYGKVKLPFLTGGNASWMHRASGDAIVAITLVVAAMCLSYFEIEDGETTAHVVAAIALLAVLAIKVVAVHVRGLQRLLPLLGTTVLVLFALTWATSAGDFLGAI
jgi:hypothetical protein